MKRLFSLLLFFILSVSVTACGNAQNSQNSSAQEETDLAAAESDKQEMDVSVPDSDRKDDGEPESDSGIQPMEQAETEQEETDNMTMNIRIGENLLTATLVQNSSTEALIEMLSDGPVTIDMSDYANMEKVGPFPESLPRNDEPIDTEAGDLILYQGNSFVIYYDTNSWNFTRLGKIDNITGQELMDILGSGDVTAVLSLPTE